MMRIILSLLSTYQSGCRRTMMTISYIETWHLLKLRCNSGNILVITNNPELMTESVNWSYEIILWCSSSIANQKVIEYRIIWISKEYRFDICIANTYVLHAILLLVTASQLMLFDNTRHIIVYISTHHKAILSLAIHGLGINVILFLIILFQPTILLKLSEILCSAFIDAWIILRSTRFKIDFRFDDMIKTLLVITGFGTSLF